MKIHNPYMFSIGWNINKNMYRFAFCLTDWSWGRDRSVIPFGVWAWNFGPFEIAVKERMGK